MTHYWWASRIKLNRSVWYFHNFSVTTNLPSSTLSHHFNDVFLLKSTDTNHDRHKYKYGKHNTSWDTNSSPPNELNFGFEGVFCKKIFSFDVFLDKNWLCFGLFSKLIFFQVKYLHLHIVYFIEQFDLNFALTSGLLLLQRCYSFLKETFQLCLSNFHDFLKILNLLLIRLFTTLSLRFHSVPCNV